MEGDGEENEQAAAKAPAESRAKKERETGKGSSIMGFFGKSAGEKTGAGGGGGGSKPSRKKKKKKKKAMLRYNASTTAMDSRPWTEKYRPTSLDQIFSHDSIVQAITSLVDRDELPHMLFYGPPGTGKTSTILACAAKMYGPKVQTMVLEINASDDNSIDTVRRYVKHFAETKKLFSSGIKLVVLDEAEQLTAEAQAALKRVIEKYSASTRFCLICNYLTKIIGAIQSRCMKFRFSPLNPEAINAKIDEVVAAEDLTLTDGGRTALVTLSRGDMRKTLNTLQSCALQTKVVTAAALYNTLSYPNPETIAAVVKILSEGGYKAAYDQVQCILNDGGLALDDVVTEIAELVLDRFEGRALSYVLKCLANVQEALSVAADEGLQLAGLVSAFVLGRALSSSS